MMSATARDAANTTWVSLVSEKIVMGGQDFVSWHRDLEVDLSLTWVYITAG